MNIRIIFILTFLVTLTVPSTVYSYDELLCRTGKVYVRFGNGVWNTPKDARKSMRLLERRLDSKVAGTSLGIKDKVIYGVSYNQTEGYLMDLLETFEQMQQTDYSQFWRQQAGLESMPDYMQEALKQIANAVDMAIVQANPAAQKHISEYDQILKKGNKIILVAHSQGNLFANIAYLGLRLLNQDYTYSFGIVSVANPDSYVAGDELRQTYYTTINEDLIIKAVPNSLPGNVDNFLILNTSDFSGHMFEESYMATGHEAEKQILDNIVNVSKQIRFYGPESLPTGISPGVYRRLPTIDELDPFYAGTIRGPVEMTIDGDGILSGYEWAGTDTKPTTGGSYPSIQGIISGVKVDNTSCSFTESVTNNVTGNTTVSTNDSASCQLFNSSFAPNNSCYGHFYKSFLGTYIEIADTLLEPSGNSNQIWVNSNNWWYPGGGWKLYTK